MSDFIQQNLELSFIVIVALALVTSPLLQRMVGRFALRIAFRSDGRMWRGTVSPDGGVHIDRSGVSPRPRSALSISGALNNVLMLSGYCGNGYFRLRRR